jgi:hypothetical protein
MFEGFNKFELDKRVFVCTIGVDGWEEAGMKFVWDEGLDLERLVISLEAMHICAEGVENACNAVDRGFIKDGIVSDPNVVGEALDHDFVCPDCT